MKNLDLDLLEEMMNDYKKESHLYAAGNFWKYYEKGIIKQIKSNDLRKFRSWPGGSGSGTISSFSGGEKELSRFYNRNFHPFDFKFLKIDNNFFLNKYNSLINKITKFCSFFSYFALRAVEARKYFMLQIQKNQETMYELISSLDKTLLEISDSEFGNPIGFYKNNKFYTTRFLESLKTIHIIKKNIGIHNIKSITELGAGIGLLSSCFMKLDKNIKYLIIDIPPASFISEYYLKNLDFKVFGYREIKNKKEIKLDEIFKDYQVCCIPSYRLDLLKDYNFDLFINIHSFQEIEKQASLNYINAIKNQTKYIYLDNQIYGHFKASNKGKLGVLSPTTKLDLENELKKNFNIKYSTTINEAWYQTIFEKK